MLQMRRTDLAPRFTRRAGILPRRTGAITDGLNHFFPLPLRFTSRGCSALPITLVKLPSPSSPPGLTRWSILPCSESSSATNLNKPSRRMDCRIKSGNDDTENHSRDASSRPSFANYNATRRFAPGTKEGGEAPKGALSYQSPLARRRIHHGTRPPVGASPRHSPPALTPMAQPQNRVSRRLELAGVLPAYILAVG